MNHQDHVFLLRQGVTTPGGVWADLGSGTGAFTLALADLLGPGGAIYSVDQDGRALREQAELARGRNPHTTLFTLTADFTRPLDLPPLDGLVMANSLHFIRHKEPVLQLIKGYLKERGRMLLVEYNSDKGNPWVPYPLAYPTWEKLARQVGFTHTERLATVPSRFLGEIYAAASW